MTGHSCIAPSPAILALRDIWIHISSLNGGNVLSNIEASVDETFSLASTLDIPNVNPYKQHIEFGQYFDYTRFRCKDNVIKDLILFNNSFNII